MPSQSWAALLNEQANVHLSGSPLASSAALTDVSAAPQLTIPGYSLQPGSVLRLTAEGVFSNTGTPTLLLGFYFGGIAGTALAASGAITTITAATNWRWRMVYEGVVRTIGSSGTIMGGGILYMPASLAQFQAAYPIPAVAQAAVTIDTTTAKTVTVGAQWGTSSPSNTLTVNKFLVESLA
jgi:hypothetical protein